MDIIRTDQKSKKCRIENALYLSDGNVALLDGSPASQYKVSQWTTIEELEKSSPDNWEVIYENHEFSNDQFKAIAGETSYGGAGFITVFSETTGEFIWILHLNNCNNFVSVSIQEEIVIAISDYSHPNGTEFRMPILNPEKIEVTKL